MNRYFRRYYYAGRHHIDILGLAGVRRPADNPWFAA